MRPSLRASTMAKSGNKRHGLNSGLYDNNGLNIGLNNGVNIADGLEGRYSQSVDAITRVCHAWIARHDAANDADHRSDVHDHCYNLAATVGDYRKRKALAVVLHGWPV